LDEQARMAALCSLATALQATTVPSTIVDDADAVASATHGDPSPLAFLDRLAKASDSQTLVEWTTQAVRTVREGAEFLEREGAFYLAYSLLTGFRAAAHLSAGDLGRTLALQGRIARQLGAMETAIDHYLLAERIGSRIQEPDLYVRALLGRGVVISARGNYPAARAVFRRALRLAVRSGLVEHEVAAHNALLMTAVAAKDLNSAFTHGWSAFLLSAAQPERRAEILVNLAEVALLAGHPDSALAACMEALAHAAIDRVLLAAYGSAATAASRLARPDLLDHFAIESRNVMSRSAQELDKAFTLMEFAEAYAHLRLDTQAHEYIVRARTIAEPAGYFEIVHRADVVDQLIKANNGARSDTGADVNARAGDPLAHDVAPPETAATLSRASRRVIQSLAGLGS
jgi:tetratricopeptide (TPR) repeat protein